MYEWLRQSAEHLERLCPHVWSVCCPRRILTPPGFTSPKYYGVPIAGHLKMMETLGPGSPAAHTMVVMSSLSLARNRVPTYFVEEEFADAVAHIRLPEGLRFSEIRWPLDSLLFVLPEAFSRRHFGWNIPFLAVSRVTKGQHPNMSDLELVVRLRLDGSKLQPLTTEFDRMVVAASFISDDSHIAPVDYTADYPMHEALTIVKEAPFNDATVYERAQYGPSHAPTTRMPDSAEDIRITQAVVEFAVKLLLALTARPKLIHTASVARAAKEKKGRTRAELWNPSMIGTGYRISRPSTGQGGTHAGPRLHWRWGHYTHQFRGKRGQPGFVSVNELPRTKTGEIDWPNVPETTREAFWSCHELKLIDPILVNAPKDEKETPGA